MEQWQLQVARERWRAGLEEYHGTALVAEADGAELERHRVQKLAEAYTKQDSAWFRKELADLTERYHAELEAQRQHRIEVGDVRAQTDEFLAVKEEMMATRALLRETRDNLGLNLGAGPFSMEIVNDFPEPTADELGVN